MNEKGTSLLEVTLVMLLIGIITTSTLMSVRLIEDTHFTTLGQQVKLAMHGAQQRAHMQQKQVRISHYIDASSKQTQLCISAQRKTHYTITMPKGVKLYIGSKDYETVQNFGELAFFANMSPAQGGTVTLVHTKLKKIIQITVRPATGKLTMYRSNIKSKGSY